MWVLSFIPDSLLYLAVLSILFAGKAGVKVMLFALSTPIGTVSNTLSASLTSPPDNPTAI